MLDWLHQWHVMSKISIANRDSEYERCVAYVPGQIWSRRLELFIITRCNFESTVFEDVKI